MSQQQKLIHSHLYRSRRRGSSCPLALLLLLLTTPGARADSALESESYSYQFAHSGSTEGGASVSGVAEAGAKPEGEDLTRTEVTPALAPEEQTLRDNIRNVLRLVDGDTVTVGKDVQVRLIGVTFPEFEDGKRNRSYEQFAERSKKWIEEFIHDPEKALQNYEGMNSRVNYKDKNGAGFVYYYLYFPDTVLEDIRKNELKRYDNLMGKKVAGRVETDKDRSDMVKTQLKEQKPKMPDRPAAPGSEKPEAVDQYVISEAKYYYDDGKIKREEIFRDGKLMVKRHFDRKGDLIEETFHDSKAHLYEDAKGKLQAK